MRLNRRQHVVVTGGTGALGTAVVGTLLEAGADLHRALSCTRRRRSAFPIAAMPKCKLIAVADLADEAMVAKVYDGLEAVGLDPHRRRVSRRARSRTPSRRR